jgi:23S rRNA (cytosine1962-C5)-methyltransferase
MNTLRITDRAEKRLKSGHLWIYSNEIDNQHSPLKAIAMGEQVAIENPHGKLLAYAVINPHALICGKILARKMPFDRQQLRQRIANALLLREQCFARPYYRLLYAEGDYLPGLIIDRYNDICVVQINSAGLESFQQDIAAILQELTACRGVLFRNDGQSREQEGFAKADNVEVGEVPEFVELEENGTRFLAPVKAGQKTGWFYDHRDNRHRIAQLAKAKKVLDVFSYIGGWGVQALSAGASSLHAIDASEFALDCLEQNAALNGHANSVVTLQGNAFDAMSALLEEGERFDVVILDPPAFIKKKKDFNSGLNAYRKGNELALRLLNKEGLLVSASCSMHLPDAELQDCVQRTARHVDKNLSLIYRGGHAADHPVHPAIKETEYLKAQIYRLR